MGALLLKLLLSAALASLPQRGDLVFADLSCGPLCDAIEEATLAQFEVDGPRVSHVGLLDVVDGRLEVLEAVGPVAATPWAAFLGRGGLAGAWLARFPAPPAVRAAAASRARAWLGAPYDERFAWGGPAFYCAELVARAYAEAGSEAEVVAPLPMTFAGRDGSVSPAWFEHFARHGAPIPSGDPGLSPLALLLRLRLLASRR